MTKRQIKKQLTTIRADLTQCIKDHVKENLLRSKFFHDEFVQLQQKTGQENGMLYLDSLYALISQENEYKASVQFQEKYEGVAFIVNRAVESAPATIRVEQSAHRFYSAKTDRWHLRSLKVVKRSAFFVSRWPLHLTNIFRKKKKPVVYWSHKVPLSGLYRTFLYAHLVKLIGLAAEHAFNHSLHSYYLALKESTATNGVIGKADADGHWMLLEESVQEFKETIEEKFDKLEDEFWYIFERVGTIERRGKGFSDTASAKKVEAELKHWNRSAQKWENSRKGLLNDWCADIQIYRLELLGLQAFSVLSSSVEEKSEEIKRSDIHLLREFFGGLQAEVVAEKKDLGKCLSHLQYQAKKELEQVLVPQLENKLAAKSFYNQLDRFQNDISSAVSGASDDFVMIKPGKDFDQPLDSDELLAVSAHDLISFELLPELLSKLDDIKSRQFLLLDNAYQIALHLNQTLLFTLTSAREVLASEEGDPEEARQLVIDGCQRIADRLTEIEEAFEKIKAINSGKLKRAIEGFNQKLLLLTNNENVNELRLRLSKAKVLNKGRQLKEIASARLNKQWTVLKTQVAGRFRQVKILADRWKRRWLLSAAESSPTRSTSDFLNDAQSKIDRLPLIYRKLYQIEPLQDMELFEGREKETEKIMTAYESWASGHYASTIVTGDKWTGITSFLNYVQATLKFNHRVYRMGFVGNNDDSSEMLQRIATLVGMSKTASLDELIGHLISERNRIVVLEDIQNLFVRRMNGFGAISTLIELIAKTSSSVFWIITTTVYTFQYLDKTLGISGHFSYQIPLAQLTNEQIRDLIIKRNRVSGFKIHFEEGPRLKRDKKFKTLSEDERQTVLRDNFFEQLNRFSSSNISLALNYWLLSTKEITDRQITISSLAPPDLSYISLLPDEKVFVIYALIIHDGLSIDLCSLVVNSSANVLKRAFLSLMEKGLIFRKGDIFQVNPLVYPYFIQLLKSRNLIQL